MTYNLNKVYDVIIIGAGIAGLAAANELCNKFGATVALLEARSRVGGRIHTLEISKDYSVDMGAMYVHGVKDTTFHPLLNLMKRYGIKTLEADNFNSDLHDNHGQRSSLKELTASLAPLINEAIFQIQEAKSIHYDQELPTLAEVLKYRHDNIPTLDTPEYWSRKLVTASIMHHLNAELEDVSLIELMPTLSASKDDMTKQDTAIQNTAHLVEGGCQQITAALLQEVSSSKDFELHLHCPIQKVVRHAKEGFVEASTEEGKTYRASALLCTVPVNILKKGTILFEPHLSMEKQKAFRHFKMGQQNKVFLEFDKPFWPKEIHYLYPNHPKINDWPEYLNLYHFSKHQSSSLLANIYGDKAIFGKKTDPQIVEMCLAPLRVAYPNINMVPKSWRVTRWDAYPYSLGSNTYCAAKCNESAIESLEKEEDHGVFFGGEYKRIPEGQQGTVEGAYDSGIESAIDIVVYLRQKQQSQKGRHFK